MMKARKKHKSPEAKSEPAGRPSRARSAPGSEHLLQFGAMGKAFTILETVTDTDQPMSMAEIARLTGLTKPTVHRVITLLSEIGFLERDVSGRGYIEGPRLLSFALTTLSAASHRSLRHGILSGLSETLGETCNFGVLTGSEVVYLDRVEAKWPLGLRFESGSQVPAHCTAIGKLLLSLQPEAEREVILSAMPLTRYTSETITDRNALRMALEATAKSGIGTDDREFMSGVVCISVPVITQSGRIVGGIAVSAPEARITLKEGLAFVPEMRSAAARLGATYEPGQNADKLEVQQ